jgi:hypothetical protein
LNITKKFPGFLLLSVFISIMLLANGGCGGSDSSVSPFAGGQGTLEDPYQIETAEQLASINDYLDKSFMLVSDIDLSSYSNWEPIGTFNMEFDDPEGEVAESSLAFVGRFDGNGHTISNLTVNRQETWGIGLFGFVMGDNSFSSIQNLTVKNVNVKGSCSVGGVVGMINGKITNINLTGNNSVEGSEIGAVGGIEGMGYGVIENCTAQADVTSNGDSMQGLGLICGGGKYLTVRNCTAIGNVTAKGFGAFSVGGLIGCIQDSPVMENCSVKATVNASDEKSFMVGGLVGHAGNYDQDNPTLIRNCTAEVDIIVSDSSKRVGGLLGGNYYVTALFGEHPEPSIYRVIGCTTSGSLSGGTNASQQQFGSIAGYGYDSTITGCTSTLTWSGGSINLVGLMHNAGDTPDPIGTNYYSGE